MSFPAYSSYRDSGVERLGDLPSHWTVSPIKAVASWNDDVLTEATPADHEIEYVEISDVQAGRGLVGSTTYAFKDAPSRARRRVRDGDVLVSTVRTYLRAIAQVNDPPENLIASTGFAILRPRHVNADFLGYVVEAEATIYEVIARSVGVSYPAINASALVRIGLPVPPVPEQAAIAAFLDREAAKIDALVEEQRRLIELLKEKRQAVISHAVTKGLEPTVPVKDSGVEWLGEIPAHWDVVPLRHLGISLSSGTSVNAADTPAMDEDLGVLKTSCVYAGSFDPAQNKTVIDEEIDRVSCPVRAGSLIVSRMNTPDLVGAAGLVREEYPNLFLPDRLWQIQFEHAEAAYIDLWTSSAIYRAQVRLACEGTSSSMQNLSQDDFYGFVVPLPDRDEQRRIVAETEGQVEKLDRLARNAERATELLIERRASLISAAVTGKINVAGTVPMGNDFEAA